MSCSSLPNKVRALKKKNSTKTPILVAVSDSSDPDESTAASGDDDLCRQYQRKTDREHVLDKPDTYIGSVERAVIYDYTVHADGCIRASQFECVPGLYKLFDEGIVNCYDHSVKNMDMPPPAAVTKIDVTCNRTTGEIEFRNDGDGIDVRMHPKEQIWIPELMFAHLRTSTNYDDSKNRITGGKNGFGIKLAFIWSTHGSIETVDAKQGLRYVQEFTDHLTVIGDPVITKCAAKPYTRIRFTPDYARFGLQCGLSEAMVALFHRRAFDIAAVTNGRVKVTFNGAPAPFVSTKTISQFERYVDKYALHSDVDEINDDSPKKALVKVYERANDRWEYAVVRSAGEFRAVSFVNSVYTSKGGKHVDFVMNKIVKKVTAYIFDKKKVHVKPASVKEQIMLFLRCDIENPAFDSQTKDCLTTPTTMFGKQWEVSDAFAKNVALKLDVMSEACAVTAAKEGRAVIEKAKRTDGAKTTRLRDVTKLVDANWAGGPRSSECVLLLCEGDSAKAGVISGLSREDRNSIGVYPMKGKIRNVRDSTLDKVSDNKEISEIKKIIGLETDRSYTIEDVRKRLRYGKVVFMTDQDLDGSHIKGLGINMFHSLWPSLTRIPGFISYMNTPILKARKGKAAERAFYSIGEFEHWKAAEGNVDAWTIKYYKGLGTSTGREFAEYLANRKFIEFVYTQDRSDEAIDLVFNKKRASCRKNWLSQYDREKYLDASVGDVTYERFFDEEFMHFSKYDCERNLPNVVDGLKTSQRKIMFAAFKKNLTHEIKVAQFSGYVSEHSAYHHGEASLNSTIVGMAQTFVGSNNINLLEPNGQFGTRLRGGKDSASERYIFTQLNPITRSIFRVEDHGILNYLKDDDLDIQPVYYIPVIPMILANGSEGIGTAYSTNIPAFNVVHVIDYIEALVQNKPADELRLMPIEPYFEGFLGQIEPYYIEHSSSENYVLRARYTWLDDYNIHITELPVGVWLDTYKESLEDKISKGIVLSDFTDMSTDTLVDITIHLRDGARSSEKHLSLGSGKDGQPVFVTSLEKSLELYKTIHTNNMNAFDENERLRRYNTPHDIADAFFGVRLRAYEERRAHHLDILEREAARLSNKARFIIEQLDGRFSLYRMNAADVSELLMQRGFDRIDGGFSYLVKMGIENYITEKADELLKQRDNKLAECTAIRGTSARTIWMVELQALRGAYTAFRARREASCTPTASNTNNTGATSSTKKKTTKKK